MQRGRVNNGLIKAGLIREVLSSEVSQANSEAVCYESMGNPSAT